MDDYVIPRDEWPIFYRQSADKRYAIKVLCDVTLLPRQDIVRALIAGGCAVKSRKPPKPPNYKFDTAAAMEMHKQGKTDVEIAAALNVHRTTISAWRSKNGLKPNIAKRPPTIRIDEQEAMRLYNLGLGDAQIANQLGLSPPTICRWRRMRCLLSNHVKAKEARNGRASAGGD